MRSVALAAALTILAPCGASLAAPTYSFVTLDVPGSFANYASTYANGINNAGQVVGYYKDNTPFLIQQTGGFLFDPATGSYTQVDYQNSSDDPRASGINNHGQVVGSMVGDTMDLGPGAASLPMSSFVFDVATGSLTTLTGANANYTIATAINDNGQIVGTIDSYISAQGTGFLRDPVTGAYTYVNNPVQPSGGIYFDGINNFGKVVGYYTTPTSFIRGSAYGGVDHSFVYDPTTGLYTFLDDPLAVTTPIAGAQPQAVGTDAFGINDLGQVVGVYAGSVDSFGVVQDQGFLYDPATSTYTTLTYSGAQGQAITPTGINDAGQITGYYDYNGVKHGFVATPVPVAAVPEPASLALLGIGAGCVWLARRRRRDLTRAVPSPLQLRNKFGPDAKGDHTMRSVALAAALTILAPCGASLAAPTYSYVTLDVPNSLNPVVNVTYANGINNAGQVVGNFQTLAGLQYGFLFDPATGSYTQVTEPNLNVVGNPSGINNRGQIVGDFSVFVPNYCPSYSHGCIQPGPTGASPSVFDVATGSFTPPPVVNIYGGGTYATAINDSGQIVGYNNAYGPGANTSFLRDPATGAYTYVSDPVQATGDIYFNGINNFGKIVGYYTTPTVFEYGGSYGGVDHSFVYDATTGLYTVLDDPLAAPQLDLDIFPLAGGTDAYGINDLGQVVGTYVDNVGHVQGFLYDPASNTYTTLTYSEALTQEVFPRGINDAGQITGFYDGTGYSYFGNNIGVRDEHGFVATPVPVAAVPEPSSLILLGIGSGCVWLARRRRFGRPTRPMSLSQIPTDARHSDIHYIRRRRA